MQSFTASSPQVLTKLVGPDSLAGLLAQCVNCRWSDPVSILTTHNPTTADGLGCCCYQKQETCP
jgi:hypothetical protein